MLLVNAVTETVSKGQAATAEFVWQMAEEYKLQFPQAADAGKSLFKYANSTSVSLPFHVAVDLRSMKLVKAKGGASGLSDIESTALSTLGP